MEFPDNVQPCFLQELIALKGQWLYFSEPVDGKSASFTIPGYLSISTAIFQRIK